MIRIRSETFAIASAVGLVLTSSSFASELQLHLGGLHGGPHSESTYSWALEYRRPITANLSASFTWLNEGHVPAHHRDGQAVQVWWHTAPSNHGLRFEVGVGPYYYFDTVIASNTDGYANAHGWGLLGSIGATWYFSDSWFGSLHLNRVQVRNSVNSTALVAGLGYRFDSADNLISGTRTTAHRAISMPSEVDVMLGRTIVNSFDSDADLATSIALRLRTTKNIALSLAYLDEGSLDTGTTHPGRRAGLAPQLWLEDDLTDHFSVGVGVGPYFATRKPQAPDNNSVSTVSALVSVTAAYAITPEWTGRLIWNRVLTNYDRDTDVVMFGLGYRF